MPKCDFNKAASIKLLCNFIEIALWHWTDASEVTNSEGAYGFRMRALCNVSDA